MLKGYGEYKETGISEIQRVPLHWKVRKLRNILKSVSIKNTSNEQLLSVTREKGIIIRDIANKEENHNFVPDDLSNYKKVSAGQFVINKMKSWQGSYGISDYNGAVSPAYFVFDINVDCKSFFHSAMRSKAYSPFFAKCSGGIRVDQWDLDIYKMREIPFFIPPISEQKQIVSYLNWKTAQMDNFITAKEKEISQLKELKVAFICVYSTRGMKHTKFSKSEYPWINEYPATWKETKLKHILSKLKRTANENDELLICSNSGKVFHRGDMKLGLVSDNEKIYQGVKKGDLLIHGMDTWHGAIAVSDFDGKCTPVVHVCGSKENKRYIAYYLQALAYKKVYKLISNGVRENTSDFRSWNVAGNINVLVPPLEEQNKIVDILDEKCAEIELTITNIEKEIALVRELRARIIADAVTGRIDVRQVAVPEEYKVV